MRKHVLTRLKTLLTAACTTLYTRQAQAAKPKFALEPEAGEMSMDGDCWLFDTSAPMANLRDELGAQMAGLTDSLGELRQTLSLVLGETPFPVEATTHAPCAIFHHDDVLFEGEVNLPHIVAQEDIVGGEASFLFGDIPATPQDITQQAA